MAYEILKSLKIITSTKNGLKVLGRGELKSAITVEASAFSESAKLAIEKVGGKVVNVAKEISQGKKTKIEKAPKTTRLAKKIASKKEAK